MIWIETMESVESWLRERKWPMLSAVVLACAVIVAYRWWTQPPAVEFDNLRYVQLLWTAVSAKNDGWLDKVAAAVESRHQSGEMSASELAHFQAIVSMAKAGQWEAASRDCYEFAEAQHYRRRSRDASASHEHSS
ncbi:MAG: hypothetical protein B7Z55_10625 [Planctomycetales bacterium 12-60-4]|nr:MAG: hypothetical protein B7Z55_10625 [Planctomycetales bacterium 12-60-4]